MELFNITSPKYSFINFTQQPDSESCCAGGNDICLPVVTDDDLIFQFSITTSTTAHAIDVFNTPLSDIQLILLDAAGTEIHNWTTAYNLQFEKYQTGAAQITYLWRNPLVNLTRSLVQCNECFSLKIKATITFGGTTTETKEETSNCFIRKCDDCFTSLLEYVNDDDYADFEYCNITAPLNRVRLYIYPSQPKIIEDKAVYRKSNGAIKQTRSMITKEYQVQTEHFPESIHDKLTVALAHDNINIYSAAYSGGISKSGEYEIEWTDDLCKAPAKFSALATPFAIRNNNCADCEPVTIPGLCAAIADLNGFADDNGGGGGCPVPVLTNVYYNSNNDIILEWNDSPSWNAVTVQYSSDGINFAHDSTGNPLSPRNYGQSLNNTGVKYFRIIGECSTGSSAPSNVLSINTSPASGYTISYTNNIQSTQVQVLLGNNYSAPSTTIYNGFYTADPLTGNHPDLPAVNAIVVLYIPGKTILQATCNGVTVSPNATSISWTGINGPLAINFITN